MCLITEPKVILKAICVHLHLGFFIHFTSIHTYAIPTHSEKTSLNALYLNILVTCLFTYTNLCSVACLHTPAVGGPGLLLGSELESQKIEK